MKKIQIYGTGCPKCIKLQANAEEAAREIGVDIEIEKINNIEDIMAAGIMMTPGFAIDNKIITVGKLLSPKQIIEYLKN